MVNVKDFKLLLEQIATNIDSSSEDFDVIKGRLSEAYSISLSSNHPTTKTGAVIYNSNRKISEGNNSFPSNKKSFIKAANLLIEKDQENRHHLLNHAERSSIFLAAKNGEKTEGAIMYMPWIPCYNCMCAIITSGIEALIFHKDYCLKIHEIYTQGESTTNWGDELVESLKLLKSAGIELLMLDGEVNSKCVMRGKTYSI